MPRRTVEKFGEPITESTTTPLPQIVGDRGSTGQTIRTGAWSPLSASRRLLMQIADTSKAHIKWQAQLLRAEESSVTARW
jgi:hypothetical protein